MAITGRPFNLQPSGGHVALEQVETSLSFQSGENISRPGVPCCHVVLGVLSGLGTLGTDCSPDMRNPAGSPSEPSCPYSPGMSVRPPLSTPKGRGGNPAARHRRAGGGWGSASRTQQIRRRAVIANGRANAQQMVPRGDRQRAEGEESVSVCSGGARCRPSASVFPPERAGRVPLGPCFQTRPGTAAKWGRN